MLYLDSAPGTLPVGSEAFYYDGFFATFGYYLYQDLSYDEILAGRPEAWLVKKICIICMQSQNLKKYLILKFKVISRTSIVFNIAFMVNE